MIDINWTKMEVNDIAEFLPEAQPQRFVVTEALVITRAVGMSIELFLINPSPDKWNHWILPFRTALDIDASKNMNSAKAITDYFDEIERSRGKSTSTHKDYPGLNATDFGILKGVFFENYSLKFSHTNNKWTAYHFIYRRIMFTNLKAVVPSIWVKFDELFKLPDDQRVIWNTPVAENVLALCKHVVVNELLES